MNIQNYAPEKKDVTSFYRCYLTFSEIIEQSIAIKNSCFINRAKRAILWDKNENKGHVINSNSSINNCFQLQLFQVFVFLYMFLKFLKMSERFSYARVVIVNERKSDISVYC